MERQEKPGSMREAMPATASIVDDLRAMLGQEWVDRAIRESQAARREHARLEAAHGRRHADAWLASHRFAHGRFWAQEGALEVGVRKP